jgi:hypothetical protein
MLQQQLQNDARGQSISTRQALYLSFLEVIFVINRNWPVPPKYCQSTPTKLQGRLGQEMRQVKRQ